MVLGIHPLPPLPCRPIWWHAIGRQCLPPQCYGRLIHVAWHSAAVDIGSRHSPIAAPSMPPLPCCPIQWYVIGRQCMPPTSCKSDAALPHILAAQGLRPTRLHRVLPVPFILPSTYPSIHYHCLPVPSAHPYPLRPTALRPTRLYCSIVYH